MSDPKVAHGSLSKNKYKREERHPEYTGSLIIDQPVQIGQKLNVAAWIKVGQDGGRYMSLSVSVPQVRQSQPSYGRRDEMDDEIPF